MKLDKVLVGLLWIVVMTYTQQINAEVVKKKCPLKLETTAYIDQTEPLIPGVQVGKLYQTHMEKITTLKKSGHFKNFKVTSQTMDFKASFNTGDITALTIRASIKFDLNYDAVSELYNRFKKSTVNVSTYEVKNCPY